jgi:DNA repair exonuclease SbcCD ATPase subunit
MSVSGNGQSKLMQELQAILDDGPNFQKRLQQLVSERLAIETARVDLNIVMQAKDAYEDASRKQQEAVDVLAAGTKKASEQLSLASAEADKTRREAKQHYERTASEAQALLDNAREKSSALIAEAEARAQRLTSDLMAAQDAIQVKLLDATRMMKEADAKLQEVTAREAAAEAAQRAASEKMRRLMAAAMEG